MYKGFEAMIDKMELTGGNVTNAEIAAYTSGQFQQEVTAVAAYYRENGVKLVGKPRLTRLFVSEVAAPSGALIVLNACRDIRTSKLYQGTQEIPKEGPLVLNTAYLRREGTRLKIYQNDVDDKAPSCPR